MKDVDDKNIHIEALDLHNSNAPKGKKSLCRYGLLSEPDCFRATDQQYERDNNQAAYSHPENGLDQMVPDNSDSELETGNNFPGIPIMPTRKSSQADFKEGAQVPWHSLSNDQIFCSNSVSQMSHVINRFADELVKEMVEECDISSNSTLEFSDNSVHAVPQLVLIQKLELTNESQNIIKQRTISPKSIEMNANFADEEINAEESRLCEVGDSSALQTLEEQEFQIVPQIVCDPSSVIPTINPNEEKFKGVQNIQIINNSKIHISGKTEGGVLQNISDPQEDILLLSQNVSLHGIHLIESTAINLETANLNSTGRLDLKGAQKYEAGKNLILTAPEEINCCLAPLTSDSRIDILFTSQNPNLCGITCINSANIQSDTKLVELIDQEKAIDKTSFLMNEDKINHAMLQVVLDQLADISSKYENDKSEQCLITANKNNEIQKIEGNKEVKVHHTAHSSVLNTHAETNVLPQVCPDQLINILLPAEYKNEQVHLTKSIFSISGNEEIANEPDIILQVNENGGGNGAVFSKENVNNNMFPQTVLEEVIDISTICNHDANLKSSTAVIEEYTVETNFTTDLEVKRSCFKPVSIRNDSYINFGNLKQVAEKTFYLSPDIMSDEDESSSQKDNSVNEEENVQIVPSSDCESTIASSQESAVLSAMVKNPCSNIFPSRKITPKMYSSTQHIVRPAYEENVKLRFVPYSQNDKRDGFQRALDVASLQAKIQGNDEEGDKEEKAKTMIADTNFTLPPEINNAIKKNGGIVSEESLCFDSSHNQQSSAHFQQCPMRSVSNQECIEKNEDEMDDIIDAEIDAAMLRYDIPFANAQKVQEMDSTDECINPFISKYDVSIQTEISSFLYSDHCICLGNMLHKRSIQALCLESSKAKKIKLTQMLERETELITNDATLQDCETRDIPDFVKDGCDDCRTRCNVHDDLQEEEETYVIDIEVDKTEDETIEKYVKFAINDYEKVQKDNVNNCFNPYNDMFNGKIIDEADMEEELVDDQEVPTYPVLKDELACKGKLLVQPKCNFYWNTKQSEHIALTEKGDQESTISKICNDSKKAKAPQRRLRIGLSRKAKPKHRLHPQD